MAVDRLLPSDEAYELLEMTRSVADKLLEPVAAEHERNHTYPEGLFAQLGEVGLLGCMLMVTAHRFGNFP